MRRAADIQIGRTTAEELMRDALAQTAGTHPHPNPRVGAVLVSPDGDVVARAAHLRPGGAHAERLVLTDATIPGSTLVVTLEPCSHHGRTPPCVDAIVDARMARVIVGAMDPDSQVSGSGIRALQDAGIDVVHGILEDEIIAADPSYYHHRRTGRTRVTLKMASTLDGQVAAADGTSQWITSEAARQDAHELRSRHDAVIVGGGTVIADDPLLDVRSEGYDGPQPIPVLLMGRRPVPSNARVLCRDPIVYTGDPTVDLEDVTRSLPEKGILSALVEGGPALARSFLASGLVDEIVWYVGAKLAGGVGMAAIGGSFETLSDAYSIDISAVDRIGDDVRIIANLASHAGQPGEGD